jgi:transcription antitermination factor NusG
MQAITDAASSDCGADKMIWCSASSMDFKPMQIDIGRPASYSAERRWYALSLRSRYEKKAHADLVSRRIESFLPLIEEVHVWSDRKKRVLEPLFRGYLFVRTDLRDRISILQAPGVTRFVQIGEHLSWIPEKEIEWVRIIVGHPTNVQREPFLSNGERVRVTGGLFNGVEGIVVSVRGSTRVVLSLDCIAQSVSVEVSPALLERLPAVGTSRVTSSAAELTR